MPKLFIVYGSSPYSKKKEIAETLATTVVDVTDIHMLVNRTNKNTEDLPETLAIISPNEAHARYFINSVYVIEEFDDVSSIKVTEMV